MIAATAAALGIITGALLGLLGGGGSILAVPILVYILGLETKAAVGTSLITVGAASLLAAASHYRRQYVQVRTALLFGASGCCGSIAGARIGSLISDQVQLALFAIVMCLIAILMLRKKNSGSHLEHSNRRRIALSILAGTCSGFLTGFLGVGGGFIIVPALTLVLGLEMKHAIGTSLLIIGMNSFSAAIVYGPHVSFQGMVIPFSVGVLATAPISAHLAHYAKQEQLKLAFSIFLLLLSIWMLAKQMIGI